MTSPHAPSTPSRALTTLTRAVKVIVALGLLAAADALAAEALSTRERLLLHGWQSLSAQQVAAGTRPTHDHLAVQGRAMTRRSVRQATRQTRNGNVVAHSERVSFFVPVVPEGWTPSQPVHVFVHTPPSGYNLVDPNLDDAPAWRGAVVDLEPEVRSELQAMSLRVADDAFVVDLGADPNRGDSRFLTLLAEAFYALVAGVAALALLASAVRSPWPETTLARRLRRDALGSGAGALAMALIASPIPFAILGSQPDIANWLGAGVCGLLLGLLAYDGAMSLWRAPAQTREARAIAARMGAPFEQVAATLDRELGPAPLAKNDLRVLPSFLCRAEPAGITLVPYERVARVSTREVGAHAALVVEYVDYVTRGAAREGFVFPMECSAAPQEVRRLFDEVTGRAPWAIQGRSPEEGSSPADLLRRYEQRRAAYPSGPLG